MTLKAASSKICEQSHKPVSEMLFTNASEYDNDRLDDISANRRIEISLKVNIIKMRETQTHIARLPFIMEGKKSFSPFYLHVKMSAKVRKGITGGTG